MAFRTQRTFGTWYVSGWSEFALTQGAFFILKYISKDPTFVPRVNAVISSVVIRMLAFPDIKNSVAIPNDKCRFKWMNWNFRLNFGLNFGLVTGIWD